MRNNFGQNVLYFLITLISFLIVHYTLDNHPFSACGSILPISKPLKQTNPQDITLLEEQPVNSQSLAYIFSRIHFIDSDETAENNAMNAVKDKIKALAASIGAKGVYIREYGSTAQSEPEKAMGVFVIRGIAYN